MPTYDYVCKACGVELEIFQSITERAKRRCPHCGESRLERKIGTGAGILFKGKGFYQTDYRSESYTKSEQAEKQPRPGGETKAPDSKPAAGGEPGAPRTDGET